ncbi:MAG TPA: hypothetical protein VGB52_09840 [Actinomycetota bacterium]
MPDDQEQRTEAEGEKQRRFGKVEARWTAAGIIALLFGIFVAQNSDPVRVSFVFFDAEVRLIWVFLICGVIGGIVDRLLQRRGIL